MPFSKKIVTLIILMNVAFAAVVLYVFSKTGSEPAALVGCWFAFTTGELWALAQIKKSKLINDNKQADNELRTKSIKLPVKEAQQQCEDSVNEYQSVDE